MVSRESLPFCGFPFRPLVLEQDPTPDSGSFPASVEWRGFDTTLFRRIWIEPTLETLSKEEMVRLSVQSPGKEPVQLAVSDMDGPPS